MTDFTPWTLLVDIGIISCLLLIGKLLRVHVRFIQSLFIPPSLLAGFLALLLGPHCLDVLPLSDNMGTYAGVLIAFVFGCIPFTSVPQRGAGAQIRRMWSYSQSTMLFQWALGGLLGYFLLSRLWQVNPAFGIAMPAGYCGGHGSAAAVGQAFGQLGYTDMLTLAMTAATVGILASVVIGLCLIKWGVKHGDAAYLNDFKQLPAELRTGLLPAEKRESMGETTVSTISMDSLTFNMAVVGVVVLAGYGISKGVSYFFPQLELPVFSCAFIAGLLIKQLFVKSRAHQYTDAGTIGHISGALTDYLVAFGIASIKISIVVQYLVPLLILLVVGLAFTLLYIVLMGRRMFGKENWFEKAMFAWGWCTGTVAMGIALLRIVDPDRRSHTMDSYALAYIFIAPVEIALITLVPIAFMSGHGLLFSLVCLAAGVGVMMGGMRKLKIEN
jgi:ESS family glutamate:Na+ symporter